jgi:AcrR family transcriptional regulator
VKSKDDLLYEVIREVQDAATAAASEATTMSGTPLVKIRAFAMLRVRAVAANAEAAGVLARDLQSLTEERRQGVMGEITAEVALLTELIGEGQEDGVVRGDVDPGMAATVVLGLLSGVDPAGGVVPRVDADARADLVVAALAA